MVTKRKRLDGYRQSGVMFLLLVLGAVIFTAMQSYSSKLNIGNSGDYVNYSLDQTVPIEVKSVTPPLEVGSVSIQAPGMGLVDKPSIIQMDVRMISDLSAQVKLHDNYNDIDSIVVNSSNSTADREVEYSQLFDLLQITKDKNKMIVILENLWRLAPEVGIHDDFLVFLESATRDQDLVVVSLAKKILLDFSQIRGESISAEDQIATSFITDTPELSTIEVDAGEKIVVFQQGTSQTARQDDILALKEMAMYSDSLLTRNFAIDKLFQYDPNSVVNIVQYQLSNSVDNDERFLALDRLRASIGSADRGLIRQTLEMFSDDYDNNIANYARHTLVLLEKE
jgi:hypothetical protein